MTVERLLEIAGRKASAEQMATIMSDTATVVSAGAGSGKTTVLSLRFVRLILSGKVHADEILTLTFTKKAAAEMYGRIYSILSEAAKEDSLLQEELSVHFPKARISTMDSFWSEIARTDSMRYGITRDFLLLDGDGTEDMVRGIYEEMRGDDNLRDGFMVLSELYTSEQILSFLVRIARDETDILTSFSAERNTESYRSFISLYREKYCGSGEAGRIFSALLSLDAENPGNGQHGEILQAAEAYRDGDWSAMPRFSLQKLRKKTDRPLSDFIKNEYRPFIERMEALTALEAAAEDVPAVSRVLERFIAEVQRRKRMQGALTFRDTEALCRRILISNTDVRDYFKKKFRYIMVDEFQDNNGGQKDLLYLLSERPEMHSPSVPPVSALDPDKLFFVGDDKQSIYYFRGADVSVFRALKNDIAAMGGNVLSLSANYRSEPALIDHFNTVFRSVFSTEPDDEAEEREAFVSSFTGIPSTSFHADAEDMTPRPPSPGMESRIELAVLPREKPDDGEEYASRADSEALFIASRIREMTEGDGYLIPDGRGGLKRPSYSDIAVLLRTTASQMPVERAFRAESIPYTVSESSSATLEGVAWDIYAFLQILVYPEDRLSYMAVLRSPFARISDCGLLFLRDMAEGEEAFSRDPDFHSIHRDFRGEADDAAASADEKAYRNIRDLYFSLRPMVGRYTITAVLDRLFYESGYHSYLESSPFLSVYSEHFSYLWAAASLYDAKGKGLPAFLDYLRPSIGHPDRLENAVVQHLGADGVQIMTIHKSKGLQFPIVILADADHGTGAAGSQNRLIAAGGANPVILPDLTGEGSSDALLMEMNSYSRRREDAELRRVLYVALTRAVDHLLITAEERRQKAGPSLYSLYAETAGSEPEIIPYAPVSALFGGRRGKGGFSWYDTPLSPPPAFETKRFGVKDSSHSENGINISESAERLPSLPSDGIVSAHGIQEEFGTMVHAALEAAVSGGRAHYDFPQSLSESEKEELSAALDGIVSGFLASEFYQSRIKGKRTETEIRFYYPMNGSVAEGSADLLVFSDEYNLVVDYKTDRYMDENIHRAQITAYAAAMEDLYGKKCRSVLLYVRGWRAGTMIDRSGAPPSG